MSGARTSARLVVVAAGINFISGRNARQGTFASWVSLVAGGNVRAELAPAMHAMPFQPTVLRARQKHSYYRER